MEDKVCLLPGYVEVKNGRLLRHYSDDPNNSDPIRKPWELKNRKEFRRVEDVGKADKRAEGKHFIDLEVYNRLYNKLDKKNK